ncbi:MAG: S41 family peptidase [Muribaculaceae bacterium]|nr:S41 family peptidase [Muribaculaceae bacterium]
MKGSKFGLAKFLPLIIALSFVAGIFSGRIFYRSGSGGNGDKFEQILDMIQTYYVDELNTDSLVELTIPHLLANLDPHSAYIPASDLQSVNDDLDGSFSGIGITFNMMGDTINVLEVLSGGPAEKVGLLAGDRIVTIDDSVAAGKKWTNERVMKTLRGAKGTKVKLGIKRSSSAGLLPFELTRGDIPVSSIDVAYEVEPGVGLIKINKFGRNTYGEFLTEAIKLRERGVNKFIIDLRGNGGGYMEPAVLIANEFLERGQLIVSTKGRFEGPSAMTAADGTGSLTDAEVVIMLDEYSASASEILAGAIQDNDRGVIVGRRSFGKGLVQNQMVLPDSSAVRLTVARYYTPSGRCIQKMYKLGEALQYETELAMRYTNGELYSPDSIKIDTNLAYSTLTGRTVYGGGGIIPDVFVPNDTTGYSSYYISVVNGGLLQKYAFMYVDLNRGELSKCKSAEAVLGKLPPEDVLLQSFVDYAAGEGVAPRWIYINVSRKLLVTQLRALICRDALDQAAYYQVFNRIDNGVEAALKVLRGGQARPPISLPLPFGNKRTR